MQKTVITQVQQGFNFLGNTVRKFGNKLLIRASKSSVRALRDKIRSASPLMRLACTKAAPIRPPPRTQIIPTQGIEWCANNSKQSKIPIMLASTAGTIP